MDQEIMIFCNSIKLTLYLFYANELQRFYSGGKKWIGE